MKHTMLSHSHRFWLVPLLTVAVMLFFYLSSDQPTQYADPAPQTPTLGTGDGDTIQETLNTLIAQVDALDMRLDAMWSQVQNKQTPNIEQDLAALAVKTQESIRELRLYYEALARRVHDVAESRPVVPASISTSTLPVGELRKLPSKDITPGYTVPSGTIFFDAVALTALIGKIPVDGTLEAPFPVMVLVGEDNIAPGGRQIHGLKGMMLSGTAVGDKALRCVSVNVDAAYFVFKDGTIAPINNTAASNNNSLDARAALGWLSDPMGLPCLQGEIIDVANRNVLAEILSNAALGYAGARQQNEINEIASVEGHVLRTLSGDANDFNRAGALVAALGGLNVEDSSNKPLEAIFVPPGQKVIAHINRQLEIDYLPTSRRIVSGGDTNMEHKRVYPY